MTFSTHEQITSEADAAGMGKEAAGPDASRLWRATAAAAAPCHPRTKVEGPSSCKAGRHTVAEALAPACSAVTDEGGPEKVVAAGSEAKDQQQPRGRVKPGQTLILIVGDGRLASARTKAGPLQSYMSRIQPVR